MNGNGEKNGTKLRINRRRARKIASQIKLEREKQGGYSSSVKTMQLQFVAVTLVTFQSISHVKILTGEFMRKLFALASCCLSQVPTTRAKQSVVGSGNSTFFKKNDNYGNEKCLKIKVFICVLHSNRNK